MSRHEAIASSGGFSLVELAVVISILSILSALAIPNVLKWVQLARIDEAKSILNSAAADCLTEGRSNVATALASTPRSLDADKISTTGYQVKAGKDKCQEVWVSPARLDDKLSYEMGFRYVDGRIEKFSFPADNPDSLNSCKAWAGVNCGASEAQLAEWARLAALQAAKQRCNDDFNNWLRNTPPNGGSGQRNRWEDSSNTCTLGTWAFQGTIQGDENAFNAARERALGIKCRAEYDPKVGTFDGLFTYSDADCGSSTYFCSGKDLGTDSEATYDGCKAKERETACAAARDAWVIKGTDDQFIPSQFHNTYPNAIGCKDEWQCKRTPGLSKSEYEKSDCGAPPPPPPRTCRTPDIWYCPWRPTWRECQPICN